MKSIYLYVLIGYCYGMVNSDTNFIVYFDTKIQVT